MDKKIPKRERTFNKWVKEDAGGEVTYISPKALELSGYQSEYVEMYSILKEFGFTYEDKHWIHPYREAKYSKIKDAYSALNLWRVTYGD